MVKPTTYSVADQKGGSFAASSVDDGINRALEYAKPGDRFRVYVVDAKNPYPGYIAAWVGYGSVCRADGWSTEKIGDCTVLRRTN